MTWYPLFHSHVLLGLSNGEEMGNPEKQLIRPDLKKDIFPCVKYLSFHRDTFS